MKLSEIMDYYYEGYPEPFKLWCDRVFKLWRFPPWRVWDYLILAVKSSLEDQRNGLTFPNFRSWFNIRWTLRHGLSLLVRGN